MSLYSNDFPLFHHWSDTVSYYYIKFILLCMFVKCIYFIIWLWQWHIDNAQLKFVNGTSCMDNFASLVTKWPSGDLVLDKQVVLQSPVCIFTNKINSITIEVALSKMFITSNVVKSGVFSMSLFFHILCLYHLLSGLLFV